MIHGPEQRRVRWVADDEPYDWGDIEPTAEDWAYLEDHGVWGCVVERKCLCCGEWTHVASVWGVCGDADYMRDVERELVVE